MLDHLDLLLLVQQEALFKGGTFEGCVHFCQRRGSHASAYYVYETKLCCNGPHSFLDAQTCRASNAVSGLAGQMNPGQLQFTWALPVLS